MFPRCWLVLTVIFYWKTEADIKCDISKSTMTYLYVCSIHHDKKIEITVDPSRVVEITCDKIDSMNHSILPDINYGKKFAELRIINCPIIHNGFQEILKKFHIEKVSRLQFYRKSSNELLQLQHFIGLESVEKLDFTEDNITHFDGNIFKLTPQLSYLDLHENNLLLYSQLFKYSPKLVSLNLSYNSIKVLPPDIFNGLFSLTILSIDYNEIKTIDNGVFRDLINLENLRLSHNLIYRVDQNAFEYQERLKYLEMDSNKLQYIPKKMLSNCTNLRNIYMRENNGLVLENMAFSELVYLNLITLKKNGIVELPENIFTGSVNLIEINLEYNKLKYLSRDTFKNLERLEELHLDNNELENLDRGIFSSLNNLRLLTLNYNFLITVNEGLLEGLEYLDNLDLSFNNIYRISSDVFARKYNLIKFSISNNRLDLTEFSANNMKDCRNIKVLNFANNSISQFPYEMLEILRQQSKPTLNMTLEHQELGSREVRVYLNNNNISTVRLSQLDLNTSTNSFSRLVRVDISKNPIYCDCQALDFVSKNNKESELEQNPTNNVILLYDTLLCADPPHLANFSVGEIDENELLCSLNKKCTKKNECNCSYKSSTETIIIDCSRRNLTELPQLVLAELPKYFDFIKLNRVQVHLEDNSLTEGPTEHDDYHNIRELYLQQNKITSIQWLPPFIEVLNLENNKLELIDSKILKLLNGSSIKELRLSNNPWRCDCETKNFITYIWTHISKIRNATHIRCQEVGKSLVFLDVEDICPVTAVLASVLSSAILICFIIISAIVFIYFIYHEEVLIWLYARDACLWLIKEERVDKNKKYDAFVSFAHQDEEFVMDHLVPILELGSPQYKLCVHIRDWIPGEYIVTQISNSVRDSRRTLIILSPNFITSIWGRMEFKTAHTSAMKEGRVRIILVIYGDVEMDRLDDELKAYIRTNTYIEWGDPWFWEKLRYALPRTRYRNKKPKKTMRRASVQNGIDLQ